jgi:hypothetical protein
VDRTISRLRDLADAPAASRSDDEHTAQTPATAFGPEPSASTHETVFGAEVGSPEKTRSPEELAEAAPDFDKRPAAHPSRGEATDVAESTKAVLPHADAETSTEPTADHPAEANATSGVSEAATTSVQQVSDQSIASTTTSPENSSATHAESMPASNTAAEATTRRDAPNVPGESREGKWQTLLPTDTVSSPSHPDASKSGLPSGTDRQAVSVPPSDTAPTPKGVAFFQRLSRRTKIGIAASAVVAVVTVVLVVILVSQSSPGGGSTATPTVTISSDPTQQLLSLVSSGDNCTPSSIGATGAVAEVQCKPDTSSLSSLKYYLFPDRSTIRNWMNETPGGGFQPCPGRGQGPQPWHRAANPQQTEGVVECYTYDGPTVSWSEESRLLVGAAVGASIDQVYQWWAARYK